jgi:acyl-coenzyme A synthetase/AMP-(fatty) acid ligase
MGLSFDFVLRELFLPLTSGATLCLPDRPGELGPEEVLPWMEREGISIVHTVPTLAEMWLMSPPPGVSLRSVRRVFFAGEPLGGALVQRWREAFSPSATIVNLYGPTETTLSKCAYTVPAESGPGVQPIGLPLPQSQVTVLAEGGRSCGIGEWGEIVIRTPYRTRGYINLDAENARRFRPNPRRSDPDDVLYHSGDRGRFRADGLLEISGRLDDQVKVRGVRIEPAEVAAVLGQLPNIRQAVVLGQPDDAGSVRLVAYVVPATGSSLEPADLRRALESRLPAAMVPSAFVTLEQLPLTPNGKVDRRALRKMTVSEDKPEVEYAPPRTATEALLTEIWRTVLRMERIGREDNFFDLGGHSLLLTQVVTQARLKKLALTPMAMFRYPTIRALAEHLSGGGNTPGYQRMRDRARRQREALARQRRTRRS